MTIVKQNLSRSIFSLFVEETKKCSNPRSRAKQDHMFDTIYIILTKTMVLEVGGNCIPALRIDSLYDLHSFISFMPTTYQNLF